MSEPIKWLYFDTRKLRYIDDDDIVSYLQSNPNSVIVEVQVEANSQLPSGVGLTNDYPALARQNDIVYEIVVSGGNLNISQEGDMLANGFLPYSGGTMEGDLILDHDPVEDLEAATKQYVDSIGGLVLSPVIENAISVVSGGNLTSYPGFSYSTISGFSVGGPPEPGYKVTFRSYDPSTNGIYIKVSDDPEAIPLHMEDTDGSIIYFHLTSNGDLGIHHNNPQYAIDVGLSSGLSSLASQSINVSGTYFQAGQEYRSFIQADFTIGTDLDSTRDPLPIDAASAVSLGSGLTLVGDTIQIETPGTYRVLWKVCAENEGNSSSSRKTLQVDLVQNGTPIPATLDGGYTRDRNNSFLVHGDGDYMITTTSLNETISVRTRRSGSSSGTFPLAGGYIRVELVDVRT